MATKKEKVLELLRLHPDWSNQAIADVVDCSRQYVVKHRSRDIVDEVSRQFINTSKTLTREERNTNWRIAMEAYIENNDASGLDELINNERSFKAVADGWAALEKMKEVAMRNKVKRGELVEAAIVQACVDELANLVNDELSPALKAAIDNGLDPASAIDDVKASILAGMQAAFAKLG